MSRIAVSVVVVCVAGLVAAGCGPAGFAGRGADEAEVTPTFEPIPTFTPTTAVAAATVEPAPTLAPATVAVPAAGESAPTPDDAQPEGDGDAPASEPPTDADSQDGGFVLPTSTPAPEEAVAVQAEEPDAPLLRVVAASVNVRRGPGTEYAAIGVVDEGDAFPLEGRNESGDWWQVCCFGDEPGWLYGPLVEVQNAEAVMLAANIPPAPEIAPTPAPEVAQEQEPVAQQPDSEPEQAPEPASPDEAASSDAAASDDAAADAGTAGNFDPNAQYQIVHYRVLGFEDNNGGIFNKGGQQFIFVTVLDENGNGVDGAIIKDAVGDNLNVSVGSKGPGKAEIKMDWDPYKLYVAADPSGPVTSQISNQMNNPYPHIPDVVGMLGPADNEYAICPTVDDRCDPPFYHAHWSYEITFQKVR